MNTNTPDTTITYEDFLKVKLHVGTIIEAVANAKAKIPAYVLKIDFGALGVKTSSAQLTENYSADILKGKQVMAVMNFPSKRVAGVKSEVLVLASVSQSHGTVLIEPSSNVPNGSPVI